MFMASTFVSKQMQAQQSRSCAMQDLRNEYYIYCPYVSSYSKYIYGQYLYEQANAGTTKWEL